MAKDKNTIMTGPERTKLRQALVAQGLPNNEASAFINGLAADRRRDEVKDDTIAFIRAVKGA